VHQRDREERRQETQESEVQSSRHRLVGEARDELQTQQGGRDAEGHDQPEEDDLRP
jgi:hypothetical protein